MKCNRTQTWWVGRIKKKISSFYTRSQKYELFCISQQQRSRIKLCDWPTGEQSNGVEWQTACVRERRLDNLTTSLTWLQAVNGLSRENIKKMARIMPLSNMVINRGQKTQNLGESKWIFNWSYNCPRIFPFAWDLRKYLRQFVVLGKGQLKQISLNSGFTCVLSYLLQKESRNL